MSGLSLVFHKGCFAIRGKLTGCENKVETGKVMTCIMSDHVLGYNSY